MRTRSYHTPNHIVTAALVLAHETSAENAARVHNVSVSSVRNWMHDAGMKPRRRGNYTMAEATRMGAKLVMPE